VETGTHLLKLVASGVFDRHPKLKVIVGHMGELIPFCATRLNLALTMGEWLLAAQESKEAASAQPLMQKIFNYYLYENINVTTSGVFDVPVFECAKAVLGIDNLLFSVDDPFQDNFAGVKFLKVCHLSDKDRGKLAYSNAERLLKLPADGSLVRVGMNRRSSTSSSWHRFTARLKAKMGQALIAKLVK